ncbi:hypothetical protein ACWGQ5_43680 [Streptomyces sp. NPDC055722]
METVAVLSQGHRTRRPGQAARINCGARLHDPRPRREDLRVEEAVTHHHSTCRS